MDAYHQWVGDGLGNVPFKTPEEAHAVMRVLLRRRFEDSKEIAHTGPSWIDTQYDEFTYTTPLEETVTESASVYSLDIN
jgi:hypothetical protein